MSLQTNIYDKDIYFAITYGGYSTYIIEPDKWNRITNHLVRDKTFFGFWSDFIEDKYGLMFTFIVDGDLSGGAQLLKDIYERNGYPNGGAGAEVYFSFGYLISNTKKQINEWRINLNIYSCDFGGVSTSIEKMPFQAKLQSRFTTPCTLNTYSGMDGELLNPISTYQLRMHSKSLLETTRAVSVNPVNTNDYEDSLSGTYNVIITPDLSNQVTSELSTVFSQPVGLINTGISASTDPVGETGLPFTDLISNFTPVFTGSCNISFSGRFDWVSWNNDDNLGYTGQPGHLLYWRVTPRVVVQRLIGGNWTIVHTYNGTRYELGRLASGHVFPYSIPTALLPIVNNAGDRGFGNKVPYRWTENFVNVQVTANDNIYVHLFIEPIEIGHGGGRDYNGLTMVAANYTNDIKITELTSAPSSTANGYKIFDVIDQMLENITGRRNALISSFFSEGGFGWEYILLNGYSIRNFGALIHQPVKSLRSLLSDLMGIFFIGIGVRRVDGDEFLVVESADYFFKTVPILRFDDTFVWKDTNSDEHSFNKFSIGYNKYEGLNIIQQDEFNTKAEYLTQYEKILNKEFTSMSDLIASGFLIEEQRRNQFNINSGQSLTNDNDWFIVATDLNPEFRQITIRGLANIGLPAWLAGFSYPIGYKVFDNSIDGIYVCIAPVTSSTPPFFDGAHWTLSTGAPYISSSKYLALQRGDLLFCSGVNVNFQIISQVVGYPLIDGSDLYLIEGGGTWSSGTWFPGNIVNDPLEDTLYLCLFGVTSGVNPSLDTVNWLQFNTIFGAFDVTITAPSPNQTFSERDENFEICSGIIDPSTVYNARLSLKHILYNWRPYFGISLFFIDENSTDYSVSQIVTALVRMNSNFTSKFISTEEHKGNIGDLTTVEINREFVRTYLSNGSDLFSPTTSEFKVRVGFNDIETLRFALNGETGDETLDYGGITAKDDFGQYWFCQVMDIQYDLVNEIATFKVQKCFKIAV